jgi:hypothetical protein
MVQKAWYDKAFVSISALSGAEIALQAKTTTLSISGGSYDVEGIETFGGRVTRVGTRDDIEVSFDGIPTSHADFDWIFAGQTASTAFSTSGSAITTSTDDRKYRLIFLWTNQTLTAVTSANQAITGTAEAYKRAFADCYLTSLEANMDAGDYLKAKLTFKLSPTDDLGVNNWGIWSKDTTSGTLSALNAYTSSSTKW